MIFYHNQLMKNELELQLFVVSNPVPFECFEDHEAALEIQLETLIQQAIKEKEDPIALIEGYLGINDFYSENTREIAERIARSDQMASALISLRDHWQQFDPTLPENSLVYGNGIGKKEAIDAFSNLTLRTYLETLSSLANNG